MKKIILLIFTIFLLSSCSFVKIEKNINSPSKIDAEIESAKATLNNFLNNLNSGQYEQAVLNYGASFAILESNNPEIKPEFKAKLLESYCLKNGGLCLKPLIIGGEKISEYEYQFKVEFFKSENSLYSTPGCPCKGGGKSQFEFRVVKNRAGQFVVMDLPPKE